MYLLISMIILAAALVIWLTGAVRVFFRYRGKMLLTCPETGKAAAVKVAAGEAARTALTSRPHVCLSECSCWPHRQGCGQECLSQLGADPHNCLVWTKVADWYRGRSCVYCHKVFGELNWHDHRPALLGPDRKTVQWSEVAAENLPEIFTTHLPVCWSCHIARTFRREHPEMVIDRPGNRGPMGELLAEHKRNDVSPTPTSRT
jgi:hypothetical protein